MTRLLVFVRVGAGAGAAVLFYPPVFMSMSTAIAMAMGVAMAIGVFEPLCGLLGCCLLVHLRAEGGEGWVCYIVSQLHRGIFCFLS